MRKLGLFCYIYFMETQATVIIIICIAIFALLSFVDFKRFW